MSDANLNQLWARALVEELVRGGVRHAVVCPGSRSSPLALACARGEGLLRTWSVIDERGAGFFALGMAKQSRAPVVLVATSGTAGAHFYPAVIEAAMAQVPLVVLTADRPLELQGWGAPQTVPQARFFGDFARLYADVGPPEASDAALVHLRATAARAVAMASRAPRGAVHLNVPFREPLAPLPEATFSDEHLSPLAREGRPGAPVTRIVPPVRQPDPRVLEEVRARVAATEHGVIVCGPRDESDGFAEALAVLSEATGYPVLAEATSQARYGGGPATVSFYDAMLRHAPFAEAHRPKLVLRFGGGLTPKRPQAWIDDSGAEVVLFSDEGALFDPAHRAARVVEGPAVAACEALSRGLSRGLGPWARSFLWAEQWARAALESTFSEDLSLTEMRIAYEVVGALPEGANLFVSSSMPIRDVDAFTPSTGRRLRVLANRGANGIDGIVSSALGVAAASGRPTVLLTGDLAFLHDVGGLLLARRSGVPLTVVVVNNDGGGIFSFLPIAQAEEARAQYEALWGTPHGVELSHAAALYGARFRRPDLPVSLRAAVSEGLETGGLHIIEVRVVERTKNVELHQQLFAKMAASLGDGPWP
jgi:2-succinyl-5-enolpyruvyl-6-hydroxy-3-cyclohexene-1-carboxylate synthase